MGYLEAVWQEAVGAWTLWALGGLLLTAVLVNALAPEERGRVRTMLALVGLSLLMVLVSAGVKVADVAGATAVHAAATIFAAAALIGEAITLVFAIALPRLGVVAPMILRDVAGAAALVVVVFALAHEAGLNLSGLIATSAVLTAVVGLSLQDTLGNIAAGLAVQSDGSLQHGDWVRVGDVVGRVKQIRWRYTAIETRNWETLIVPNAHLVKEKVLVLGRRDGQGSPWRRWVWFNVDFAVPPPNVIEAVEAALTRDPIPRVASEPRPNCILMELGESYARYAVRYWLTDLAVDDATDSDIRTRIHFALERADIAFAMPQAGRFITQTAKRDARRARAEAAERRAALLAIDLFRDLDAEDVELLARGLRHTPFGRGETLTRQGSEAHWLYLIRHGEVAVHVAGAGGQEQEVARLRDGDFFGEMSLLTGAPRSATVVAVTDVDCYRLDKQVFQELLSQRPALADRFSALLADRQVELDVTRRGLDAASRRREVDRTATDLGRRIRAFFGLGE